jgi:hypothetical protein
MAHLRTVKKESLIFWLKFLGFIEHSPRLKSSVLAVAALGKRSASSRIKDLSGIGRKTVSKPTSAVVSVR